MISSCTVPQKKGIYCSVVFECEDLLLKIQEFLGGEQLYLLKLVNKCFLHTIQQHHCQHSPSHLNHYCSSLSVLAWAVEHGGCPNESTCAAAAGAGNLPVLQWLRHRHPPCAWGASTLNAAAGGGHLAVLQWLQQSGNQHAIPWQWYMRTCHHAAKEGHLHTLQWLRDHEVMCNWNDSVEAAAEGGRLRVLQWLRTLDPPVPWTDSACFYAAKGGFLEILKWLRAQDPPCPWTVSTCSAAANRWVSYIIIIYNMQVLVCS
jgi:hypothetical protein